MLRFSFPQAVRPGEVFTLKPSARFKKQEVTLSLTLDLRCRGDRRLNANLGRKFTVVELRQQLIINMLLFIGDHLLHS